MNVFGVGPTEIFIVLIVILVLFGPDKLPEIAKKIGGASREIRDNLNTLNDQMNNALESSMELDKARMVPPAESTAATSPVSADSPAPSADASVVDNRILRGDNIPTSDRILPVDSSSAGDRTLPDDVVASGDTILRENSSGSADRILPDNALSSDNTFLSEDSSSSDNRILPDHALISGTSIMSEDSPASANRTPPEDSIVELPPTHPPAHN